MITILDARYIVMNGVGAVAAQTKLQRLKYDPKNNFKKFINLFELRLDEALSAGNNILERDQMFQLTSALGPNYVPVLNSMSNDPPQMQTFLEFFKRGSREACHGGTVCRT